MLPCCAMTSLTPSSAPVRRVLNQPGNGDVEFFRTIIRDFLQGANNLAEFEVLGFHTSVDDVARASRSRELPCAVGIWVTFRLEQKVLERDKTRLVAIHWRPLRASVDGRPLSLQELDGVTVAGIDSLIMAAYAPFDGREWWPNLVWTGGRLFADQTDYPDIWASVATEP